jgi:hypothetical protein
VEFKDGFLGAIGAWQRGWLEQQDRRQVLAANLLEAVKGIDDKFRAVDVPCFRKRFLHSGELVRIILENELREGVVSWTTSLECAEEFKGIVKLDAVSGAIFRHQPDPSEVVLNLATLWSTPEFAAAVDDYQHRGGDNVDALIHFRDRQGEVILTSPLRGTQIIRFSGTPSPFDELCDQAGIAEAPREEIWRQLFVANKDPTMPRYTDEEGAKRAVAKALQKIRDRIAAVVDQTQG